MEESNSALNDSPKDLGRLGFWEKIGILALGTTLVSITLCLVACVVKRGCFLFNRIHKRTMKETEDQMFEAMKKKQIKFHEHIKQHREQRCGTVADGDGASTKQPIVFGYGSHGATSSQARFYARKGTLPILEELENNMEETSACPARFHDVQSAELSSDECTNCREEGKGQTESLMKKLHSADDAGENGGNLSKFAPVQQSHRARGVVNKGSTEMQQRGGNPSAPQEATYLKLMPFHTDGEETDEQTVQNVGGAERKRPESDAATRASDACVEESDECSQRKGREPPVAKNTENEGKQKQPSFDYDSSMSISSAFSTLSMALPSALSKKPRSASIESSPSHAEERKQSTKNFSSLPSPPLMPSSAGTASSEGKRFSSASLTSSRSASTTSTSVLVEMPNINLSFHLMKKVPESFFLNKVENQTTLDEREVAKDDDSKESSPRTPMAAEDENIGLLTMKIENVVGLPSRDYSPNRNPFVRLVLIRDRRLLRRRSTNVLANFQTPVVKHELNPVFGQAFTTEIAMTDFKNIRLNIEVLDADRHTKTTEICSTTIPLKEIKPLKSSEDPVQVNYQLTMKKQQFGKLFLAVTYLPTAQRLSFNVVKAANLQHEEVVESLEEFRPYVRILQINSVNGKVMKKKRTGVKTGTKDPQFDDTLNFAMTPDNLNSVVFLILLSHRSVAEEKVEDDEASADSASRTCGSSWPGSADELLYATARELMIQNRNLKHSSKHDPCLGTVCLGPKVAEENERIQWLSAMMTPRKAFSMWQTFY